MKVRLLKPNSLWRARLARAVHPLAARHKPLAGTATPLAARRKPLSRTTLAAAIVIGLFLPQFASACPVCFGDPNSPMAKGTSNGIVFLLGTVFFVQLGFVAMFWSFWRRAKALRRRRESMRVIQGGAL
jgi:hypothetical protein